MADIKQYEPLWGAWHVDGLIGEGSFGKVYQVRREEFGNTYYSAVKIISVPHSETDISRMQGEGMDEASLRSYFQTLVTDIVQEIDLMNEFRGNSNIVSFEDYKIIEKSGQIGWDILIRMELLSSLTEHAAAAPLPQEETIKLGIHICKALELCAQKKTIHRDIKPDNIFVSQYGNYKLGDFGIARQIERTVSGMSKKGTFTYMAPEVFKGEEYGADVDTYSLGIVMYRLLNKNRTPFLPDFPEVITPQARDEALRRRMSGEPIPLIPGADPALNEIILKACAYERRERYTSPAQMREALEALAARRGDAPADIPFKDRVDGDKTEILRDVTQPAREETDDKTEEIAAAANKRRRIIPIIAAALAVTAVAVPVLAQILSNPRADDDLNTEAAIADATPSPATAPPQSPTPQPATTPAPEPAPLPPPTLPAPEYIMKGGFQTIAAGEYNTMAIDNDGSLWVWGQNSLYGQINVQGRINFPVKLLDDISAVAAGSDHNLFIKTDGSLWAWGRNDNGQIGNGTRSTYERESENSWRRAEDNDVRFPIQIMEDVIAVSAGYNYSMAITEDGNLWVWGRNDSGQLGNGVRSIYRDWNDLEEDNDALLPVKVMENAVAIAAGREHCLAVTKDGSLWAWGGNYDGQIGNGTMSARSSNDYYRIVRDNNVYTPIKIMEDVEAIAAGGSRSMAVTADGSLWIWGNYFDGSDTDRSSPTKTLDNVKAIAAGNSHSLAVTADGNLWSWGSNYHGQLGDGISYGYNSNTPAIVHENVVAVAAGQNHSMAITADSSLWVWGDNRYGQVGNGTMSFEGIQEENGNSILIVDNNAYFPVKVMDNVMIPGTQHNPGTR